MRDLPDEEIKMTLVDHLEELRQRILRSIISIILCACSSLIIIKPLVKFLEIPAGSIKFLQISPGEFLFVSIKVAGYAGIIISLPYIIFQVLAFVLPGLTKKEKNLIAPAVAGSAILFLFGIFFGWSVLVPAALKFLVGYGADVVEPLWSIEKYLDFVLLLLVSSGISFQVPILQVLLSAFGIVNWKNMISVWRWVLMVSAIAGAILTPSTDPITMILLGGSISILFLIGVGLSAITDQWRVQTPPSAHPPSKAN